MVRRLVHLDWGESIIQMGVYQGLYWGSRVSGNSHISPASNPPCNAKAIALQCGAVSSSVRGDVVAKPWNASSIPG